MVCLALLHAWQLPRKWQLNLIVYRGAQVLCATPSCANFAGWCGPCAWSPRLRPSESDDEVDWEDARYDPIGQGAEEALAALYEGMEGLDAHELEKLLDGLPIPLESAAPGCTVEEAVEVHFIDFAVHIDCNHVYCVVFYKVYYIDIYIGIDETYTDVYIDIYVAIYVDIYMVYCICLYSKVYSILYSWVYRSL